MERITIVGMGPIGASIGLGLRKANLSDTEVVGASGDRDVLGTATKIGAVDKTIGNLRSAVEGAHLLVLDTPLTETRDLLEALGPILEDGCVVTDTGATKGRVLEWAAQYLPKGTSYVGGHPLLKKQPASLKDASAALFQDIPYCVIPAKSASQQAVRTVIGVVETLGARPLFLDPHEHDSYAAAMAHLPIVLSSAFVTATAGSDGWREMHRLAASEFAEMSRLASNDPQDNEVACLASPDTLVHWLDQIIAELYSYRNQIKERSENLVETFVKAWEARARWEAGAVVQETRPRIPSAGDSMATAFLGERLLERYRKMTDSDKKKASWKYAKKG